MLAIVKKLTASLDVYNCIFQFSEHVRRKTATTPSREWSAGPSLFRALGASQLSKREGWALRSPKDFPDPLG